jgi:ABC-type bacteriocin/lantibiotic exporter with double-glycine peptidase domain
MIRCVTRNLLTVLCLAVLGFAQAGVWLDVPFVKQDKNACGAASIAMVMQYWQRQQRQAATPVSDAEQIQRALYSRNAHGIFASDLQKYFAAHGYRAFAFHGAWDDLQQHLAKGRPLIVALKPGRGDPLHYVVVTGLDPQQVLTNDPAQRKLLKQDRSEFEKQWRGTGNWTLLAVPQSGA